MQKKRKEKRTGLKKEAKKRKEKKEEKAMNGLGEEEEAYRSRNI